MPRGRFAGSRDIVARDVEMPLRRGPRHFRILSLAFRNVVSYLPRKTFSMEAA